MDVTNEMRQTPEYKERLKYWEAYAKAHNVVPFRIARVSEDFCDDELFYDKATDEEKAWCYERGFLSERIARWGLTKENYRDFSSDAEFYSERMYKNKRFYRFFDDKMTTWYVLCPFRDYLPVHYFSIENNCIRQLNVTSGKPQNSAEAVVSLLKEKGILTAKASLGGHGKGFIVLTYDKNKNEFARNDVVMNEKEMTDFLLTINGYMITEFIRPNKLFKPICGDAACVIRVVTTYTEKEGAHITAACARFGIKAVGALVDFGGCFWTGITLDEGKIFKPMVIVGDGHTMEECDTHPDTNAKIEGFIPHWDMVKEIIPQISNYLCQTPYLTFDVVVTDDSIKTLEINQHGMVRALQPFFPFYKNKYQAELFAR